MNIVITGASGFVGTHLVPKLLDNNHRILEITIEPQKSFELYGNTTIQVDYMHTEHEELREIINNFQPDVCVHLASYLTAADDYGTLQKLLTANIQFACSVLDVLKTSTLNAFINTGSFAEYYSGDGVFDPAYLYTATKTASRSFVEYYSKTYHFKNITIVPYTIYGGVDTQKKIIDIIYDSISSNETVDLTPGEQVLDFIHVEDVTDFYIDVVNSIDALPDKINFHLGTGVGTTIKQLTQYIEEITGKRTNINWGGKDYRSRDVMFAVADISPQQQLLNWKPKISLEEGVRKYIGQRDAYESDK